MDNIFDHMYTSTTYDIQSPVEFSYKMTGKEIESFVKLRVSNNSLFSGRRNAAKYAWRAVLKHMGLQGAMTHSQASKKWNNMKQKYMELKHPPEGAKVSPDQWPYFTLMDDALQGRLATSAPILVAQTSANNDEDFLPCRPKKRMMMKRPAKKEDATEVEVLLNKEEEEEDEEDEEGRNRGMDLDMEEVEKERAVLEREREVLEREREVLEREREALQRERAGVQREMAALQHGQALLERERALMVRETGMMEREREVVEKEKAMLNRDWQTLKRDREALGRRQVVVDKEEPSAERGEEEEEDRKLTGTETLRRKERFLTLFEKLIETL